MSATPNSLCSQPCPTNYNCSHPKVWNFTVLDRRVHFRTHCQSKELKDTLLTILCYNVLRNYATPGSTTKVIKDPAALMRCCYWKL